MGIGDKIFLTAVSFIFVFLLWVGILQKYFPMWGCLIVGIIIAFVLIGGHIIKGRKEKLQKKMSFVEKRKT